MKMKKLTAIAIVALLGSLSANADDYAVYSLAGWGTYINDTGAIGGDFQLTPSVADHIVYGQFDADPYHEVAYSVAGGGIWIQNCDPADMVGGVRDTSGWQVTTDDSSPDLAAADLNGDGLDEVIFTIPGGAWAGTYANNRTFAGNTKIHGAPAALMASGQFDADASDELVLNFAGSGVWIHDGLNIHGTGGASDTSIQPTPATSLGAGNVDGLGIDEVIYSLGDGSAAWHGVYVDPAGVGAAGAHYKIQGLLADSIAAGDVDADGSEEILFGIGTGTAWAGTYVNENGMGTDTEVQNSVVNLIASGQFDADASEELVFNIPGWGVYVNDNAWGSDVKIQNLDATALAVVPYVIPEPATLGLFAMVGGGMLWMRKRFMI